MRRTDEVQIMSLARFAVISLLVCRSMVDAVSAQPAAYSCEEISEARSGTDFIERFLQSIEQVGPAEELSFSSQSAALSEFVVRGGHEILGLDPFYYIALSYLRLGEGQPVDSLSFAEVAQRFLDIERYRACAESPLLLAMVHYLRIASMEMLAAETGRLGSLIAWADVTGGWASSRRIRSGEQFESATRELQIMGGILND